MGDIKVKESKLRGDIDNLKEKACYDCLCKQRVIDHDTGVGIGKVGQPEVLSDESLYVLLFLFSMKHTYRVAVKNKLSEEQTNPDNALVNHEIGSEYLFNVMTLLVC